MEWLGLIKTIIRDYGNLGTIILIALMWQWFKHRLEKQESAFNARLEKQELAFNARLEKQESAFNARLDKLELTFNARFKKQELTFNARLDNLTRVLLFYAKGMLNFNKSLINTFTKDVAVSSSSAYENLIAMADDLNAHVEGFLSSGNPLSPSDGEKLKYYLQKVIRRERFTWKEAKDLDRIAKLVADEYLFEKIEAWDLNILSAHILALCEPPTKEELEEEASRLMELMKSHLEKPKGEEEK